MKKELRSSLRFEVDFVNPEFLRSLAAIMADAFGSDSLGYQELCVKHLKTEGMMSIGVLVRANDEELVAARCLLVDRHEDLIVLQNCETAVRPSWRGKGIFLEMTRRGMQKAAEIYPSGVFVNFPNSMRLGGYLKLGFDHLSLNKGMVIPKLHFAGLFKSRLRAKNTRGVSYKAYKGSRWVVEVLDYSNPEELRIFATDRLLKGQLVVGIGNDIKMVKVTTVNCVFKKISESELIESFRPKWIDTVAHV